MRTPHPVEAGLRHDGVTDTDTVPAASVGSRRGAVVQGWVERRGPALGGRASLIGETTAAVNKCGSGSPTSIDPAGEGLPHPRRLRGPPWPQAVRGRRPWLPPAHRPCRRGRARGPRWSGSTLRPRRGPNGGAPAHRVALGRVAPVLFLCCGGIALTPPLPTGWCEETL